LRQLTAGRHGGRKLPHHAHPKETAGGTQGAIVENKRLDAALQWIAKQQRQRDLKRLANRKVTLGTEKRIREVAGIPAEPARATGHFYMGENRTFPTCGDMSENAPRSSYARESDSRYAHTYFS
jgi:hypothetical protein